MIGFARAESVATLHWESLTVAKEHDLTRYSWFERSNRVNMRDVRQISALSRLIPRLESRLPGPIVIMSGQDESTGFKVVHGILALISIAFGLAAGWIGYRRLRRGSDPVG